MNITTVCSHCRNHDKEPNLEINFKDGVIYYVCSECKKESKMILKAEGKPLPRLKRM